MELLITGGSGFIGRNAVDKLISKGHSIRILDVIPPHRNDVNYLEGSILDSSFVNEAVNGVDVIYHFAGMSNINKVFNNPIKTINYNIIGTANILEASRLNNINRVIIASSVYVYSNSGHLYTYSKKVSEELSIFYNKLYDVQYTILRLGTVYGPNSRNEDVVSLFLKQSINEKKIKVNGDGEQVRNFIHVTDVADACCNILSDKCVNKILTIAGNEKTSIKDLAHIFSRIFNSEIIYQNNCLRIDDYQGSIDNIQETYDLLEWQPSTTLEDGIVNYCNWYNKTNL